MQSEATELSRAMPKPVHSLRAGNVRCEYIDGSLRHIRIGNCEAVQHIYFAVRDRNWNTIPLPIQRQEIRAGEQSFQIDLEAEHKQGDIAFVWRGSIRGTEDGVLTYSAQGEAQSDFLRNRIGLCVLHPADLCRGRECTLEHTDGHRERARFPDLISPHQPFFDLRAIAYQPAPGVDVEVRFRGDIFETEDQRNWSDASFKTYSTPLSIPYPAQVHRGDQIAQQVEVSITAAARVATKESAAQTRIVIDEARSIPMSSVGVVWGDGLAAQHFAHMRVDLDLRTDNWRAKLGAAARTGAWLEAAALLVSRDELPTLHSALAPDVEKITRLMLFDPATQISDPDLLNEARSLFRGTPVGGGSNKYFAELNRNRALVPACDFLVWPIDPQVHLPDADTALENLAGQRPTLETAHSFADGRPLYISPLSIPEIAPASGWAVIALRNLLLGGARSITFQRSLPVLEEICRFQPQSALASHSSHPLAADALVLRNHNHTFAWVANFLPEPHEVLLGDKPLLLQPHTVTRIECQEEP